MLDIDMEEALIKKVGGKFALTTLLQRRMVELNRGAPPLVKLEGHERNLRRIVCREILEDKILLGVREAEIQAVAAEAERIEIPAPPPPAGTERTPEGDLYGSDIKKIKEQRIAELAKILNPPKA